MLYNDHVILLYSVVFSNNTVMKKSKGIINHLLSKTIDYEELITSLNKNMLYNDHVILQRCVQ